MIGSIFNLKSNFLIVKVEIFNQQGQMVETLQAQNKEKRDHQTMESLSVHSWNIKIGKAATF